MPARPAADRCPGLLRPHRAEDGLLARLRIPGGHTTSDVLLALVELAQEFAIRPGPGSVQLTSRGNLQLRGLDERRLPKLTDQVYALGLLPSIAHDRVRNIVASPLTGLTPERPDLRPLVHDLDRALCADQLLAELPGRFLFALDDGRGDVTSLSFDVAYLAEDADHGWLVLGGDHPRGRPVANDNAVAELTRLARDFVRARNDVGSSNWRVWELPDLRPDLKPLGLPAGETHVPLGAVAGAASISVPLAFLSREHAVVIHQAAGGGTVVITPWRGLVIPGAAESLTQLAEVGLVVDDADVWSTISACVGAPGCAKSRISTAEMARALAARLTTQPPAQPVHIVGCERRCGAPALDHVDLVAPQDLDQALSQLVAPR